MVVLYFFIIVVSLVFYVHVHHIGVGVKK
jgi:hypothetical protein